MNYDVLAWIILGAAFLFIVVPLIGSIGDTAHDYGDCFCVGLAIIVFFGVLGGGIAAIIWAINHLFA